MLDGALLSTSGIYAGFVDYIADLYGDGTNVPDYFAKEQEQYHYTVVRSLTNTAGYLSGYSTSNYIKAINSFAPSTNMWELQIAFKNR